MHKPLLSVIVPVYKAEKYIHRCINSILNQSITDLELILVDDGSPDNSGTICDEYARKNSRIKVFHQKNAGVCAARNKGLENAEGKYVCFVDSDDYLEKNAMEILYIDILSHNADISCGLEIADKNCDEKNLKNGTYEIWKDTDAIKNSLLDNRFTYSVWAKLFKRELIENIRFEEGRKINEDSFFVFSCCMKKPVVVVRNVGIYYQENNPDSVSHSEFSEKFFDILYFSERKQELINEKFPEFKRELNNIVIKANFSMLYMFCRTNKIKYIKDMKKCIKTVKNLKEYFVPLTPQEKRFFFIVTHNLYFVYKIYYNIKYKKK